MIKKTIEYVDYNDETQTEDFYFNLTKDELIQLEVKYPGGFEGTIKQLSTEKDTRKIYDIFRKVILDSYGKKSEDGKRFIKSPELTIEFEQSPAFSELIFSMIKDAEDAAKFMEGLLPKDLLAQVKMDETINAQLNNS